MKKIILVSLLFAGAANAQPSVAPGVPLSGGTVTGPIVNASTVHDEKIGTDGVIAAASTAFAATSATFTADDVGKTIIVNGAGAAGADLITTIAAFVDATHVTLADASTFATPWKTVGNAMNASNSGVSVSYAVNDVLTVAGGTASTAGTFTVLSLGVNAMTVNAGGSGGTNGACTVQGTTGVTRTNWKGGATSTAGYFTATGTVSGGALTGALVITQTGDYTTAPTSQAAEPVVPLTGCTGLTGATVALKMAPHDLNPTTGGHYTVIPSNPVSVTGGTGTGATLTLTPDPVGGYWAYGTDDTAAINTAIARVMSTQSGGTVVLPAGRHLVLGALVLPYTGTNPPIQNPLVLTGQGHITGPGQVNQTQFQNTAPFSQWGVSGTILDLRYTGSGTQVAKIDTRGSGSLEINNISLWDGGTDNLLFILTTNTILNINNTTISGNPATFQRTNTQNGIRLGGITAASSVLGGVLATNGFQGYISSITHNYFDHIREAGQFGGSANAVVWRDNQGTYTNGSNSPTSGFLTLYGVGLGTSGNAIGPDGIECTGYANCIVGKSSGGSNSGNTFIAMGCWDTSLGNPSLSCINLDTNSSYNTIYAGYQESDISQTYLVQGASNNNTMIGGFIPSLFYKGFTATGNVGLAGKTSPGWPLDVGTGTGQMVINLNGGTSTNQGSAVYYNRGGVSVGATGQQGAILGGTSTAMRLHGGGGGGVAIGQGTGTQIAVDNGGNLQYPGAIVSSPVAAGTVTFAAAQNMAILTPAGALATLTVQLPNCAASQDGDERRVKSTQAVAALTVTTSSGSVVGPPTSIAVGTTYMFHCHGAASTWY